MIIRKRGVATDRGGYFEETREEQSRPKKNKLDVLKYREGSSGFVKGKKKLRR